MSKSNETYNKEENEIIGRLTEEWKQNVSLYIDQDKRGIERIKVFLALHAGLLVIFSAFWVDKPNELSTHMGTAIAVFAILLTIITGLMCQRAHAYILLRRVQAMLIENQLRKLILSINKETSSSISESNKTWGISKGVFSTFTREHVAFLTDEKIGKSMLDDNKFKVLKNDLNFRKYLNDAESNREALLSLKHEIYGFAPYAYRQFAKKGRWKFTMGHLDWLMAVHFILGCFWLLVLYFVIRF